MPKTKSNSEVYAEIMSEIATRAVETIDGVELFSKTPDRSKMIKDNDVHVYFFSENNVNVDIYLNIVLGYNIPDIVCKVQEAVKSAIEKETCYKVTEVNVSVVSIKVLDDDKQIEIVHEFSEDDNTND